MSSSLPKGFSKPENSRLKLTKNRGGTSKHRTAPSAINCFGSLLRQTAKPCHDDRTTKLQANYTRENVVRLAYLILAHNAPTHLGRLIAALQPTGGTVFVHVDVRSDERPFREATMGMPVVFVPFHQRMAIHWCGFSMVEATLRLVKMAFTDGADRFVLMSGTDYPVKSPAALRAYLEQDLEFIQIDRLLDPLGNSHFDRCANRAFAGDFTLSNPRTGRPGLVNLVERVAAYLPRRTYSLPIYYGPSWWALTRTAIADILRIWRDEPTAIAWFRFSRSPDEMVFQTLLKSSSRSHKLAFDATIPEFTIPRHRAALHYANWDRPNPAVPRIVEQEDYDEILASGALFVRKIDPVRSKNLIDNLDAYNMK